MKSLIFLLLGTFFYFSCSDCPCGQKNISSFEKEKKIEKPSKKVFLEVTFKLFSGETLKKVYEISGQRPEENVYITRYNNGVVIIDNNCLFGGYMINTGIIASYVEVKKIEK